MRSGVARALALLAVLLSVLLCTRARADFDYTTGEDTVFAHSATAPYWLSGQLNSIFQWHPRFSADYSGPHSFEHASEQADSVVLTLYSGLELTPYTEVLLDVESAGGSGLSQGLGLGGYTNIDVVRNPELDMTPYFARAEIHQVIPLGADRESADRTPLSLLTQLPARRIDLYLGRFALNDFFDTNPVASDSHSQFLNWAVVNTAAYDYAADTRGYTWGGVLEFTDDWWTFRFGEALLSKRPNGLILQKNLQNAHSENYELEVRREFLHDHLTIFHLLAFTNFANMGDYHQAITNFRRGLTPTPEIDDHPPQVALKYGFAFNAAQEFPKHFRGFIRLGWNEGQHESWNYTEVDQTVALGGDLHGNWWGRPRDALGVALVSNGLSHNHREYLALGGLGFVLGDGRLNYAPERLLESYYNFPIPWMPGWYSGLDLQCIDNPGYNQARGPVIVLGGRIHVEL